jgi:tetratricopeptide (TPR) repeat protein
MNTSLVGAQRLELVASIQRGFDTVVSSREAKLMLLVGDPGEGKTRLVLEFYQALAARQAAPAYWPASFLNERTSAVRDALQYRKVVGPQGAFVWQANTLPTWLWWGINCGRTPTGGHLGAIDQHLADLTRHFGPVLLRWAEVAPVAQKTRRLVRKLLLDDAGNAIGADALGHALDRLAKDGLLAQIPMASMLYNLLRRSVSEAAEFHWLKRLLREEVQLETAEQSRLEAVAEIAGQLRDLARPGIPIVIAIEDAHLADPGTCALLESVLRPDRVDDAPIFVVATATPEGLASPDSRFAGSLPWLEYDYHRAEQLPVEPLDKADLARLCPADLGPVVVDSSRYATPLAVELLGSLWSGTEPEARPRLLNPQEAGQGVLEHLFTERFNALSAPQRQSLLVAAGSTPRGLGSGNIEAFLPELIDGVSEAPGSALEHLPESWITRYDNGLCTFREDALAEVVFRALDRSNPSPMVRSPAATRDFAIELARRTRSFRVALHARWIAMGLTFSWSLPVSVPLVEATARLADDLREDLQYEEAAITAAKALEWNNSLRGRRLPKEWEAETRRVRAMSLHHGGELKSAMKEIQSALRLAGAGGGRSGLWRQCALDLAWMAFERDDLKASEQALTDLLEQSAPIEPDDRGRVLMARNVLALIRGRRGDLDGACRALEEVVRDSREFAASDGATLLVYAANLATLLGRSGHFAEAVRRLDGILEDYQRLGYSLDHPSTYNVQLNRLTWVASSGDTTAATSGLADLAERIRRNGAERSMEWISVSWVLASLRAETMGIRALPDLRSLQHRATTVLGSRHRVSLSVRLETCKWLIAAGRAKQAARNLRRVADDAGRAEARDVVEAARVLRVFGLWMSHRPAQAVAELEGLAGEGPLLSDWRRISGISPRALLAQIYGSALSWAESSLMSLWQSGGEALSAAPVSAHRSHALGSDSPRLPMWLCGPTSRLMVVYLATIFRETPAPEGLLRVADSQRLQQVPQAHEVIPPDQQRQVAAARTAARAARSARRYADAVTEYEKAATILALHLPDSHPDVLTELMNGALARGDAGDARRSLQLLYRIAKVANEACGPFHPITLHTLLNIAWTTHELGRNAAAHGSFEELGFRVFWAFEWGEVFGNWAVSLADCVYLDGQTARAMAHLSAVTKAAESSGSIGLKVADRCRAAARNIAISYVRAVSEVAPRMAQACRQLLGADTFRANWQDHLRCAEYLVLLGFPEDAATQLREAEACDGAAVRTDPRAAILAALLDGDTDIQDMPLLSLARSIQRNDADAVIGLFSSVSLADLSFPLTYFVWDRAASLIFDAIETLDRAAEARHDGASALDLNVLLARHRQQDVKTRVDSALAALLQSVATGDARDDISAAVEWRCLEGLALCGITGIEATAYEKYAAEAHTFDSNDPRLMDSAELVAALSEDAAGLDPLREILRGRLEPPSQATAWEAASILRSYLEGQLDRALHLVDSEPAGGGPDMSRAGETAAALVTEWMSLIALDLDLRASQGIDPRQAYGLVTRAFAFLVERELAGLTDRLRDQLRHRVQHWSGDGGLLELIDTCTWASGGSCDS